MSLERSKHASANENGKGPSHRTTPAEIAARIARARDAQRVWAARPLSERRDALVRAAKDMLAARHEIVALVAREVGKVETEGLFNEALGPLEMVQRWSKVVEHGTARRRMALNPLSFPKKRAWIDFVPRGVVGIIAPWNFPVAGLYRSVLPALLTGNAVVLKPSEHSPQSSAWFLDKIAPHVPDGLVHAVFGDGTVGASLVDSGIDACVFTGSPRAGKLVRVRCAELGIPCSAEMGGKDPAIVLEDCDLPRTVAGLTQWSLSNVGQACGAIEVALVDERVADELVSRLAAAWTKLRVGTGPYADIGPVANAAQLAVVERHVADAVAKGAKLVCGGARTGEGLCWAPTLLDRCDERMAVVTEETFGPVLAIVRTRGAADAERMANALPYGLGASIWTSDVARAERMAERLDYGVVVVNDHALTGAMPELPWSGTRETGFGVANSELALPTYVRPKTVLVDAARDPEFFWLPYDGALRDAGELLADAQLGKVLGAVRLPLLLRERVRTLRRFFEF
jgi:acyl-CoA reductase-like NAD-dependent aldehyde dehydrogenase